MKQKTNKPSSSRLLLLVLAMMAGCSSPNAPSTPHELIISGPSTGLPNRPYSFVATVNFTSQAMIYYRWSIDDSTFTSPVTADSSAPLMWKFKSLGVHIIKAEAFKTGDNILLCIATDTFTVVAFSMSIMPDSVHSFVNFPLVFTATPTPSQNITHDTFVWTFDTTQVVRVDQDTVSYEFPSIGKHNISVACFDSAGEMLSFATTIASIDSSPFWIAVSPNVPKVLLPSTFLLVHQNFLLPAQYAVHWTFDGIPITRFGTDTVSYTFNSTGIHHVSVTLSDSMGHALGSAHSAISVNSISFWINGSPGTTSAFSQIVFHAHIANPPNGSSLHWDFGDGTVRDTGLASIVHSYSFTGTFRILASLIVNGIVVGMDSTEVTTTPNISGFSLAQLLSFRRVHIVGSGSLRDRNPSSYCHSSPSPMEFDSVGWDGMHFSYNYSVSQSSPADSSNHFQQSASSSSYRGTNGLLSSDGMTIDSITAGSGSSSSRTVYYPSEYGQYQSSSATITGLTLHLIAFTGDSAIFGYNGIAGDRIGLNGGCSYDFTDPNGTSGGDEISIDPNAVAWLLVTFYKK